MTLGASWVEPYLILDVRNIRQLNSDSFGKVSESIIDPKALEGP